MSGQRAEAIRMPLAVSAGSRRSIEDRLRLRFPGAFAFSGRLALRLRPDRRLRQTLLRRSLRLGVEAANRGDLAVAFAAHHPNVEAFFQPEFVAIGFEPVYRGREARLRAERKWRQEFGLFRLEPEEMVDAGDGRLLVVGRQVGRGLASGAGFEQPWGMLLTISRGWVVREELFFSRAAALEAVGLAE